MKILIVHNNYKFKGGEDSVVINEMNLLRSKGNIVDVLYYNNDSFSNLFSKINPFVTIFNYKSFKIITYKIKEFKPDVIHVHNIFYEASPSILIAARILRIPIILTIHNYRFVCVGANLLRDGLICEQCINTKFGWAGIRYNCFQNSKLKSFQLSLILFLHNIFNTWNNSVSNFIFLTQFARDLHINSALGINSSRAFVKPNFVFDHGYLDSQNRENYFLFIGRISIEKGIPILTRFIKKYNIKIEIIGNGPLLDGLKNELLEYSNVTIWESQGNEFIIQRLKKCRALIFPSIWYEGLPMTILESFSVGTPVIAPNISNINTIIQDKINGLLYNQNDIDSLYKQIEVINMNTSHSLYKNARLTYEKLYSQEIAYNKLINIYRKTIKDYIY